MPFGSLMRDAFTLQDAVDRLVAETVAPAFEIRPAPAGADGLWSPPLDVYATDDAAVLVADFPGVDPERLDVTVERETVTMGGTLAPPIPADEATGATWYLTELSNAWSGAFRRVLRLPFPIDADKVEATFVNGRLTLRLPKAAAARPIKLPVKVGASSAPGAGSGPAEPVAAVA